MANLVVHGVLHARRGRIDGATSVTCPEKRTDTPSRACRISRREKRIVVTVGRTLAGSALVVISVRMLEWISPASAGRVVES